MKYFLSLFLFLFSLPLLAAGEPTRVVLNEKNVVSMNAPYENKSVASLLMEVQEKNAALPAEEPIYLLIYSGGGSIVAGLELIENLQALNRPVHTITVFAASMGFQTVQNLGNRYILKSGVLMSHKARGGFEGEFPGQVVNRLKHWISRVHRLDVIAAEKSNMSVGLYKKLRENEYWCEGQKCVERGFADAVVEPVCDASLLATKKKDDKFVFMGLPITIVYTYAKCPTQTSVLDFDVKVGGRSLFGDTPNNFVEKNQNLVQQVLNFAQEKIENTENHVNEALARMKK